MSGAVGVAAGGREHRPHRVALISASFDMRPLSRRLAAERPGWTFHVWPETGFEEADIAIGWNCPPGIYDAMPRLELVHGIAAGVDNLIAGQNLRGLPVCRVVDDAQVKGMVEYVMWCVLYFHRRFDEVLFRQRERRWQRPPFSAAGSCRVGIMGLGEMGGRVAAALGAAGYAVNGWSRTPREIDGVATFAGPQGLDGFLGATDVLVCLLPLTPDTRGILNGSTFGKLPHGAALVQCGRGDHLVVADAIAALESGQLRGAIVDVFSREPLAGDDPLWTTPGLVVTPHMATMAGEQTITAQILEAIEHADAGLPLPRRVDTGRGY